MNTSTLPIASRITVSLAQMALIEDIRRPSSPVSNTNVAPTPLANIPSLAEEKIVPQPASALLALPAELRLMICSYMTLSPESADSLLWWNAFISCHRLHKDMRDQLNPANDLVQYLAKQQPSWTHGTEDSPIATLRLPRPYLGVIRDITLHTSIPTLYGYRGLETALTSLYSLYLDELHVVFTGSRFFRLPYGCMKSFPSEYFIDYVSKGKVNCGKVTFTIEKLAGGKTKQTIIENIIPKTNISYVLTIVQDENEAQVERAFESNLRFRPLT
jgi:hypothetical protein